MKAPRGLSADEAAVWAKVAATVEPIDPPRDGGTEGLAQPEGDQPKAGGGDSRPGATPKPPRIAANPLRRPSGPPPPRPGEDRNAPNPGLDSHWERRLRTGTLAPDFTLDLHEHSLDAAYQRLLGGLGIARETGARVVLVIAGKERPTPAADRSGQRGAIRAKLLDWLAASRHAPAVAAVRKAHPRHGGDGALYIVLKRNRA